ncbi:bacteriocin class II family protein [Streptococcus dentasini]
MTPQVFEQFDVMDTQALAAVEGGDGNGFGSLHEAIDYYYIAPPPINPWVLDMFM